MGIYDDLLALRLLKPVEVANSVNQRPSGSVNWQALDKLPEPCYTCNYKQSSVKLNLLGRPELSEKSCRCY